MFRLKVLLMFVLGGSVISCGAQTLVISAMDELRFAAPKTNGAVALVQGREGKAVQFTFGPESRSTFATSNLRGSPEWDRADGFSFWVKGDGSNQFGGIELIWNDDYALRYDYCFPIRGKEWAKVVVPWQELIPVLPRANAHVLDRQGEIRPSKLGGIWFGRWWYWQEYPPLTFTVDDILLEPAIARDTNTYLPAGAPLQRTLARLKAKQPITIVTMGDSLTDFHHWANRQVSWPNLLRDALGAKYGARVTIVNPAIGGTLLRQNLVLMPRWLEQTPQPDLVTICFGGNDWDSGMRGELFREANIDAIDRIRRATNGKADVLLMTTLPTVKEWETRVELVEACRAAARERHAGLADTAQAFWTAGKEDHAKLFAWDKVHLSAEGHQVIVNTIIDALK